MSSENNTKVNEETDEVITIEIKNQGITRKSIEKDIKKLEKEMNMLLSSIDRIDEQLSNKRTELAVFKETVYDFFEFNYKGKTYRTNDRMLDYLLNSGCDLYFNARKFLKFGGYRDEIDNVDDIKDTIICSMRPITYFMLLKLLKERDYKFELIEEYIIFDINGSEISIYESSNGDIDIKHNKGLFICDEYDKKITCDDLMYYNIGEYDDYVDGSYHSVNQFRALYNYIFIKASKDIETSNTQIDEIFRQFDELSESESESESG